MEREPAEVLKKVCEAIECERVLDAGVLLSSEYPFSPRVNSGRRYSHSQSMRVFVRDGFIDRYSGQRLVFPGALRALSVLLPTEFPFHPNWRTDQSHFAFYELFPTIDHIVPVSRGGLDDEDNWVSTSMLRNASKANFTIEELGWQMVPPGDFLEWDGLTAWFLREFAKWDELAQSPYLRKWAEAANQSLAATV